MKVGKLRLTVSHILPNGEETVLRVDDIKIECFKDIATLVFESTRCSGCNGILVNDDVCVDCREHREYLEHIREQGEG